MITESSSGGHLENGSPDQKQRCTLHAVGGLFPPPSYLVLTIGTTWLENRGHGATRWLITSTICSHSVNSIWTSRSQDNHKLGTLTRIKEVTATREGIFSWGGVRANAKAPKSGFLFTPRNVRKEGGSDALAPCCCYLIPRKYPLPRASLFSLYLHLALRLATSPPPWCSYWQLLLSLLPPEWITTE